MKLARTDQLAKHDDRDRKSFSFYAGTPPDFEEWVAEQMAQRAGRGGSEESR